MKKLFAIAAIGLSITAALSMAACGEKETGKKEISMTEYTRAVYDSFNSYTENYQSYEKYADMKVSFAWQDEQVSKYEHSYIPEGAEDDQAVTVELEEYYKSRIETTYDVKRIDGELFLAIDSCRLEYGVSYDNGALLLAGTASEETLPPYMQKREYKTENTNKITFGVENGTYYFKIDAVNEGSDGTESNRSSWKNVESRYYIFETREDYVGAVEDVLRSIDDMAGRPYDFLGETQILTMFASAIKCSKENGKYFINMDLSMPYFDSYWLEAELSELKAEISFCDKGAEKMYYYTDMGGGYYNVFELEYEYQSSLVPEANPFEGSDHTYGLDWYDYLYEMPE